MTVSEQLLYFEERIQKSNVRIARAIEIRDLAQIVRSLDTLFEAQLMCGLMRWRLREDPTSNFESLVTATLGGLTSLKEIAPERDFTSALSLSRLAYVASLVGTDYPPVNMTHLNEHVIASAFLGNVLIGAADIADWPIYSDKPTDVKHHSLARETNSLYAGLLDGKISDEEGVKIGASLYSRRKRDSYYSDSAPSDGGGDNNLLVVDYCLGAVLKKIGSTVPTVHAWVW